MYLFIYLSSNFYKKRLFNQVQKKDGGGTNSIAFFFFFLHIYKKGTFRVDQQRKFSVLFPKMFLPNWSCEFICENVKDTFGTLKYFK